MNALTSITMLTGSSVLHRPAYCPASFKHWISKHNLHGTFHEFYGVSVCVKVLNDHAAASLPCERIEAKGTEQAKAKHLASEATRLSVGKAAWFPLQSASNSVRLRAPGSLTDWGLVKHQAKGGGWLVWQSVWVTICPYPHPSIGSLL